MSTIDPQLASEYATLERLLRAVTEYREEISSRRKTRGLSLPAEVPRIEVEVPDELSHAARAFDRPLAPLGASVAVTSAAQPPAAPQPEQRAAPIQATQAPAPATATPQAFISSAKPVAAPSAPVSESPAAPAAPSAPATTGTGTSPGIAFKPSLADVAKMPTSSAAPTQPTRRPGVSPSMQVETLGAFLRRFKLAAE